MNNQRQFRQLQNMEYRTPRQEQRMQFLARQQGQQQPQYRQQQPMPESAYSNQPYYGQPIDYNKLFAGVGGQAMGAAAMGAGFQSAPRQQMPFQGNPGGRFQQSFQQQVDGMGMIAPEQAASMDGQELRPDNMEMQQPFPMPRGGMEEMRGGYNFDRNALPGSSGNMGGISNAGYQSQAPNRMRGGIQGNMGGISNAGYQSQAPNALQRSQGISGNVARGGYHLNRVKGLLATKPPQV